MVESGLASKSSDFHISVLILKETASVGCISKYLEKLKVAYLKEAERQVSFDYRTKEMRCLAMY